MPFGYHVISIGLEATSLLLHVPVPISAMLQKMDGDLVKQLGGWNVEHLKASRDKQVNAIEKECRRWFAMSE